MRDLKFGLDVLRIADLVRACSCFGTLQRWDVTDFSDVPEGQEDLAKAYDEMKEWARGVTQAEFDRAVNIARLAAGEKKATEWQGRLLVLVGTLAATVKAGEVKKKSVISLDTPTRFWSWARGLSFYALHQLWGYHWDDKRKIIIPVRLLDVYSDQGKDRDLMKDKIGVFHGDMKTGKTTVAHGIMRWICAGKHRREYWCSDNYDSLGSYCREHGVANFGGYIFDDCAPYTLMKTRLSVDDWRGVFELQGGSFSSRYAPAGMCPDQYRILTMNSRRNKKTGAPESFFQHFELPACDALMRNDLSAFKAALEKDAAGASIAARGIFFHVSKRLLTKAYVDDLHEKKRSAVDEEVRDNPIERDSDEESPSGSEA
jgi:hypothetical protein